MPSLQTGLHFVLLNNKMLVTSVEYVASYTKYDLVILPVNFRYAFRVQFRNLRYVLFSTRFGTNFEHCPSFKISVRIDLRKVALGPSGSTTRHWRSWQWMLEQRWGLQPQLQVPFRGWHGSSHLSHFCTAGNPHASLALWIVCSGSQKLFLLHSIFYKSSIKLLFMQNKLSWSLQF